MQIPTCSVTICIAVSENGITECSVADSSFVQQRLAHQKWLDSKRDSNQLWHIKTVKVLVPMPTSYEELGDV